MVLGKKEERTWISFLSFYNHHSFPLYKPKIPSSLSHGLCQYHSPKKPSITHFSLKTPTKFSQLVFSYQTMAMGATTTILFLFSVSLSRATDMSIVDYTNKNIQKTSPPRTEEEVMGIYREWLVRHGRAYNGVGEEERRFEIFKDNLKFIDMHNSGDRPYKVGLNRFADLTNEEYRSIYLGTKTDAKRRFVKSKFASQRYAVRAGDKLPESVDWRESGAVAPIKNQGSCGSCWAFSTVAAVEGINQIATGELIQLSEQELVDCDKEQNTGCNGGLMDYAFDFIIRNGGMDTESDYPYLGIDTNCNFTRKNAKVVSIDGYEDVPPFDEKALKKAVAHQPVSVAIEASGRAWQLYLSGVFTAECGMALDHGVSVVGYGTENGVGYWIVRNSWGSGWGENGYIRMERDVVDTFAGKCGIAMQASYPIKNGQNPYWANGDAGMGISSA